MPCSAVFAWGKQFYHDANLGHPSLKISWNTSLEVPCTFIDLVSVNMYIQEEQRSECHALSSLAVGNSRIDWPCHCHCINAHFIALVHLPPQLARCHLEYISVSIVYLLLVSSLLQFKEKKIFLILTAFSFPKKICASHKINDSKMLY